MKLVSKRRKRRREPKAWSLKPPKPTMETKSSSSIDLQQKAETINLLLLQPEVDLWKLRELCLTEGGLVNDTLRKRAWPKLVGFSPYSNPKLETSNGKSPKRKVSQAPRSETIDEHSSDDEFPLPPPRTKPTSKSAQENIPQFEIDASVLEKKQQQDEEGDMMANADTTPEVLFPLHVPACVDQEQIERDVARCTWHLLTGTQRSRRLQHENKHRKKVATILKKKQKRLANLINLTMSQNPELRYYQGYHDVACIFLHALGTDGNDQDPLGVDLPARVLQQVSMFHFKDSCSSSFQGLQQCLHWTIFPLLTKLDPELHNHLKDCDMEPFFCLSWIITWFSHDVRDTNLVKRLFDAFLVSHPLLVVYVSLAMMTHPFNRAILLGTDCDFAALHHTLSMLPRHSSTVGWKKARQGGYISADIIESDEEEEEEENGDSEQWDGSVAASDDMLGQSHTTATTTALTPTPSVTSSVNGALVIGDKHGTTQRDDQERVPFQALIETALGYMQHYPPTCLMELASWYYQQELLDAASPSAHNIRMLQPSPTWAIEAHTTADWVDKQRIRQQMGLAKTSRKDRRRKRIIIGTQAEGNAQRNGKMLSVEEYLQVHKRAMAVVASGQGPYGAKEEELHQKRVKLVMRGAVVVGLSAIVIGVLRQYSSGNEMSMEPPLKLEVSGAVPNESIMEMRVPETAESVEIKASGETTGNRGAASFTNSKSPIAFTAKSLSKSPTGGNPALPDKLTPAKLFPSPSSSSSMMLHEVQVESNGEKPKQSQVLGKIWNDEVKRMTMAIYRYLYHWASKLIMKPIQFLKNIWK
ncbi:MAG: hypothetical protein SGBAC_009852 [Bacillariaceae sp.]